MTAAGRRGMGILPVSSALGAAASVMPKTIMYNWGDVAGLGEVAGGVGDGGEIERNLG